MRIPTLIGLILLCLSTYATSVYADVQEEAVLRIGITAATARNQYALLEDWRSYLQEQLHQPVELVFRDNYRENIDLMEERQLDFVWLSAPAYLAHKQRMVLVATPIFQGRPYDRAYLIVSNSDSKTTSLLSLKDSIYAYVDTDSCTGYLQPRYALRRKHIDPDRFFKKAFFTHDHQKVVAAVAIGLADAGSLSGYAWEALSKDRPDITSQTRIVAKSGEFGFPPIVARSTLGHGAITKLRKVLLAMSANSDGKQLLKQMSLDGFVNANPDIYQPIALMMKPQQ